MKPVIRVENVSYTYDGGGPGEVEALLDVSLEVAGGELVAIIGHNGSGKSTLAKHMNAIFVPTRGDVYVLGMNTRDESRLWDIRQTVGMVFQNPDNQIVATTVEEDVAFGPENLGVPPADIRRRVDEALAIVDMTGYEKSAPHMLSGGQKQRLSIARALVKKPPIYIFDDSFSALDFKTDSALRKALKEKTGESTVLIVTQRVATVKSADQIIVLDNGRIVGKGTHKELMQTCQAYQEIALSQLSKEELA